MSFSLCRSNLAIEHYSCPIHQFVCCACKSVFTCLWFVTCDYSTAILVEWRDFFFGRTFRCIWMNPGHSKQDTLFPLVVTSWILLPARPVVGTLQLSASAWWFSVQKTDWLVRSPALLQPLSYPSQYDPKQCVESDTNPKSVSWITLVQDWKIYISPCNIVCFIFGPHTSMYLKGFRRFKFILIIFIKYLYKWKTKFPEK